MKRFLLMPLLFLACSAAFADPVPDAEGDTPDVPIGTTVVGDTDVPLGLFLAPWKNASRAELLSVPGLHDVLVEPVGARGFSRSARYYALAREYRAERLMRNH